MVRWYYRSIFDELEDMRKYTESLSRQMYDTRPMLLLPGPDPPPVKMLPGHQAGLRVDVTDTGREVVVTAAMVQGILKQDITLTLISPRLLEISCECKNETREEKEGYFQEEQSFRCTKRIIPLPRPVTEDGSSASFRDGVVEVHLKKSGMETRRKISIE